MTCYSPLQAFQKFLKGLPSGKPFFTRRSPSDFSLTLPCGQCIGCRLERSRQWAVRCVHEASLYEANSFITLTYSNDFLPKDGSLDLRDFQLFMKRLRRSLSVKVRFYHCGEYGERFKRPHFHACLFGFDFPDRKLWKINNDVRLYTSEVLTQLWPFGFSTVGDVTFDSAAYVARYIMKKKFGKNSWLHYADIDFDTGEVVRERKPEYTTMSRRPGIAKDWLDKYLSDVYPSDELVINGKKCRPPRYYDSLYEIHDPSDFLRIKQDRRDFGKKFSSNNTPERLDVRRKVKEAQIKNLVRDLES